MIEDEKDVKQSAEATSTTAETTDDVQPTEVETENSQSSEKTEGEEEKGVDYEAELTRLRESRDREKLIAREERRKRQEAEEKQPEAETSDDDLDTKLTKKLEAMRLEQAEDLIDEELEDLSNNPAEKSLILEIYKTRFADKKFNRRSIRKDLEDAKYLANASRFKAQLFAEAKKKAKDEIRREQSAAATAGGASTRREPKSNAPAYTAEERQLLDFASKAAKRGY